MWTIRAVHTSATYRYDTWAEVEGFAQYHQCKFTPDNRALYDEVFDDPADPMFTVSRW